MDSVTLETLEGVPEALHGLFEEKDGAYQMRRVETEDDVAGLKTALEREREARKRLEKTATKFGDIDPDEYARLKREAAEREEAEALAKGEYEKLLAKRDEQHAAALAKMEDQLKATKSQLEQATVSRSLREAIDKAGFRPELKKAVELLLREEHNFDIEYQDGRPVGVFRDEFQRAHGIDEYVTQFAQSDGGSPFMPPDVKAGGGATGGRGAGGAVRKSYKDMSEREKMDLADELTPDELAAVIAESYNG